MKRREFLRIGGGIGLGIGLGLLPFSLKGEELNEQTIITILSTNDMHSRIDPFPQNDKKNAGLGGMARRGAIINSIRQEGNQVLLLDAGDIFQGTPYYNVYKGELELKIMSKMGYDAATLGNHEFDDGIANIAQQIKHANFPFICSNYDFSKTQLHEKTIDHKIFEREGIKIGVYGLGIEPKGLITPKNYEGLIYHDPIEIAKQMETKLKNDGCQLIIALSHLGYSYESKKISDIKIAQNTEHTNLIIGGHTHTFLNEATRIKNLSNKEVLVSQTGWGGINIGRTDFIFTKKFTQIVSVLNTTIIL